MTGYAGASKLGVEAIRGALLGSSSHGGNLQVPALAAVVAKDPANLSELRLLGELVNVVDPEVEAAVVANLLLDLDGDGLLATLDVLPVRGGGDRPVGEVVGAHGREARLALVEFNASLDPFAGVGLVGVGHGEDETGLVVLVNVVAGESDGDTAEAGKRFLGEEVLGGYKNGVSKSFVLLEREEIVPL